MTSIIKKFYFPVFLENNNETYSGNYFYKVRRIYQKYRKSQGILSERKKGESCLLKGTTTCHKKHSNFPDILMLVSLMF